MFKLLHYKLTIIIVVSFLGLSAQNSMLYVDEDYDFKLGIDLFEKEKYALAQTYFEQVVEYYGNEHSDVKTSAEYYAALCSIELFNNDATYRITKFIADYPESPLTRLAYFEMGKQQYRLNNYEQALIYFKKVWKQHLNKDQLYEYYFKLAYSYFKTDQFKPASKTFYELIDKDTKYKGPGLYYYSHIAYKDGNYETALKGFIELQDDATFSPIAPYYIIQIYFLQGKEDKVLEYGPDLLSATGTKREAEISRLVGEALYNGENYSEALPYLEKYKEKAEVYTREDIYQLGYAYYMNNKLDLATETLSNITNIDDELCQNAYYLMADAYLKQGLKEQARIAFGASSKLTFDEDIKEISMLNYAKLSYELSYSPFNETLTAFYDYLTAYPNSYHRDEAYSYLAKVYLTSKNYSEALASLNKIEIKTPEMMEANQRVSFYRGLELFNNLQFEGALAAFELSLNERSFNKQISSQALYWKAEAHYRLEQYGEASKLYEKFLYSPGAYLLDEYNLTYYNLGYSAFKQKLYDQSINWFRKYTDQAKKVDRVKLADAYIRTGDSYFVTSKYNSAIKYYSMATELDTFDVDYAMFQKGFSNGLMKKYDLKIQILSELLEKSSYSVYGADAYFERGRSFVAIDSIQLALNDFDSLLVLYPNSSYIPKSLLQLGLLNYGMDNNEMALINFKKVIEKYSGSKEAKDALFAMKNIYVDLNRVDDYFAFVKNLYGNDGVNTSEKDSLTYISAERVYMSMQWEQAEEMFSKYLADNTSSKFNVNARYYRGDCYVRLNNLDSALTDFMFVVSQPKNIFTEPSLVNAAELQLKQKSYSKAFELFTMLENQAEVKANLIIARNGQMVAAYKDSNYNEAIEAAKRVLITEKLLEEEERDARLIMARSYKETQMLDFAITQYRILAQDIKNIEGAEAKYRVSELLYDQNRLDESEEVIMEFISVGSAHQYWLAKSFILLSDIYVLKDDKFQAKANLLSVMHNYKVLTDGIMKEAEKKYDHIVTLENRQFKKEKQESLELIQETTIDTVPNAIPDTIPGN